MIWIRARLVALLVGALLAGLGALGLEATPELHAALHGWAEATAAVLLALAPVLWREVRERRAAR